MAPPRKPTGEKKLEGTDRADRANPAEPQFEAKAPPMPRWLTPLAADEWRRVVPELERKRLLATVDQAVLAAYCEVYAEVQGLTTMLRDGRQFLVEEDEQPRKYPLAKERREAIMRLQALAGELGLSPASRSKVSTIGKGAAKDPMAPPDRPPRSSRVGRPATPVN